MVRGKIKMVDNLKKKDLQLVNRYAYCLAKEESIEHLLVTYKVT